WVGDVGIGCVDSSVELSERLNVRSFVPYVRPPQERVACQLLLDRQVPDLCITHAPVFLKVRIGHRQGKRYVRIQVHWREGRERTPDVCSAVGVLEIDAVQGNGWTKRRALNEVIVESRERTDKEHPIASASHGRMITG